MATTFDTLPAQIDKMFLELEEIKIMITMQKTNEEQQPKYLNFDKAIEFLSDYGVPISKSLLYKLTAKGMVPVKHVGRTLIFDRDELEEWIKKRLM